jgi:hypothetical protein
VRERERERERDREREQRERAERESILYCTHARTPVRAYVVKHACMRVRGAKCASSVELVLEAEGAYSNKVLKKKKLIKKILEKNT